MSEPRKLLVPIDFSKPSVAALRWAIDYAQNIRSEIHVLHVVERVVRLSELTETGTDDLVAELGAIRANAEKELAALAAPAKEKVGALRQHVGSGKPAVEIVRIAKDLDADLIIMGTHGLTGVERLLIGSVAEQVVRRAHCTVVTVKG